MMKLKSTLLTSLMGISSLGLAATTDEQVNVNVNVDNGEGKVVIVREVNGKTTTTEKSFTSNQDTDIDALVDDILAEHGIEHEGDGLHKEVIKMVNEGSRDVVWVQKNDDVTVDLVDGQATVVIKKDHNGEVQVFKETIEVNADTDVNALIDQLMSEHGIEAGDAEVHKKIIKLDRKFTHIEDNKPRLGFMAKAQDNGWEIISVVPNSGAADAGLLAGDVIIAVDGQSTTKKGLGLTEFIAMDQNEGDVTDVTVLRQGNELIMGVTAMVLDSPDIIMEIDGNHKWFSSSENDFMFNTGDLDAMFEGLHVDVEHLDDVVKGLGDHEIHVVTTGDADAYFFSGSKMNQWLGKKHHFSTITAGLGQYFGTTQGVLVLEVDANNKLGLKDGDVIQAINGTEVTTPKDVVKIMSQFKSEQSFEIEIIRNKETLYLES